MFVRTRISDEGSITALVVVLAMTFVACAGLAVDGGRLVAAKIELGDHAENAARAGAQEVVSLRSGSPEINRSQAVYAVEEYLVAHGVDGDVYIQNNNVTVHVSRKISMTLLSLFGVNGKTLSAQRSATPVSGS
ncbi:MAG: Tad domain-containing protein [Ilumatobacteraceae bacterium]